MNKGGEDSLMVMQKTFLPEALMSPVQSPAPPELCRAGVTRENKERSKEMGEGEGERKGKKGKRT